MNPYWLAIAFTVLTQFVVFVRWLHRRVRDSQIERTFVRDMATNHLPHIYHAIEQIAARLDVKLADPPPLRFVSLNDYRRKSDAD
jgi:hypothetical protein